MNKTKKKPSPNIGGTLEVHFFFFRFYTPHPFAEGEEGHM